MTQANSHTDSNARELARKLAMCPPPLLAIKDLKSRWHCSRATVDRIRKAHRLISDGHTGGAPAFSLITILEVEGMQDPLVDWLNGTHEQRTIMSSPLLTIDDLALLDRNLIEPHFETFRRRAREGKREGIRLGRRWLFSPVLERNRTAQGNKKVEGGRQMTTLSLSAHRFPHNATMTKTPRRIHVGNPPNRFRHTADGLPHEQLLSSQHTLKPMGHSTSKVPNVSARGAK